MEKMKVEHIAVGYNSEKEADRFFMDLLGLEKTRSKLVAADLMKDFFRVNRESKFIVYSDNQATFEVFITNDKSKVKDIYTHSCLLVENRESLLSKATSMGYDIIKVPRKDGKGYYLFIRDLYRNLYEIKEE
jgi:hypothetical protein